VGPDPPAASQFRPITGLSFTHVVPGNYLRVRPDGREINRSLSRTNFEKAIDAMPAAGPSDLKDRRARLHTWGAMIETCG